MRLYVDIDQRALVISPAFNGLVSSLDFRNGEGVTLELQFLRDGAALLLDPGTTIQFVCKKRGKYDDTTFLIYGATSTAPADATGYYEITPVFDSGINALLGTGTPGDSSNERDQAIIGGQIYWAAGNARPLITRAFDVQIDNTYLKGAETDPSVANPSYPPASAVAVNAPAGGGYLIDASGIFKLWDKTTQTFRAVWFDNGVLSHE